ncbi:hypothetical protein FACS1894132_00010 [Clostridia bacterium]|nr:hypothetical protein FACS1894132_00010 [Clostridia bacterium]
MQDPFQNFTIDAAELYTANGVVYAIEDYEAIVIDYTNDITADVVIPFTINGYIVTAIDEFAFFDCAFKSIILPDSITSIGDWAFGWCESLENITIPYDVAFIGAQAFSFCPSLSSITVDEFNYNFRDIDGVLFDINAETLI